MVPRMAFVVGTITAREGSPFYPVQFENITDCAVYPPVGGASTREAAQELADGLNAVLDKASA
jgi:hypothetical protein